MREDFYPPPLKSRPVLPARTPVFRDDFHAVLMNSPCFVIPAARLEFHHTKNKDAGEAPLLQCAR